MFSTVKRTAKKVWVSVALLSMEVITLTLLFLTALTAFLFLAENISKNRKFQFDQNAFAFLKNLVSDFNTDVMEFFSFIGSHTFLIPANLLLILYFLFVRKHRWYSITVPVVSISSLLLMLFLKYFFHRDRPMEPLMNVARGYSFPSGHALMSVTFYGLLIFLVWQKKHTGRFWKMLLTILFIFLILMIGTSRIYLKVHYASDILAGYSMGFVWLLLSLWITGRMEIYSKVKVDPIVQQEIPVDKIST
ncbi:hypothetical protein BH09BAC2_BH09BAC2_21690 [soil metagenome]